MQLLEREPALDALGGWFAEARANHGRVVLVGGEAGVGKTTLVNEFSVRQGHAGRILRGACDALTTPRPHGPLADVAPALGGRLDQLLREEAPREVLFSTLLERLLAARVATALVIEDVHWADEATLDLLRFLARRLGAAPVLLVVTYRDDEVGPLHPHAGRRRRPGHLGPGPPAAAGAPVPPGSGRHGRPARRGPGHAV
jgi:predicted ATPase